MNLDSDDAILLRLTDLFRDIFDDPQIVAHRQMTANDVESWDSLSNVRMLVAVEQEFGIHFSSAEVEALTNVGALVDAIKAKL